jgi:hypothetical protein
MLWLAFTVIFGLDLTSSVALYPAVKIVVLTEGADPTPVWKTKARVGIFIWDNFLLKYLLKILFVAGVAVNAGGPSIGSTLGLLFHRICQRLRIPLFVPGIGHR